MVDCFITCTVLKLNTKMALLIQKRTNTRVHLYSPNIEVLPIGKQNWSILVTNDQNTLIGQSITLIEQSHFSCSNTVNKVFFLNIKILQGAS